MSDDAPPETVLIDATDVEPMMDVDPELLTDIQALLGMSHLSIQACMATLCHVLAIGITASADPRDQSHATAAVITTIVNAVPGYAAARKEEDEDEPEQPVPDRRH